MNKSTLKSTSKGVLYVVATPIGNKEDITIRAVKTLQSADIILSEDTRKTGLLLKKLATNFTHPHLESFFEGNEEKKIGMVLGWLSEGKKIALVSNSGTPLISDPGFKLVRESIKNSIEVSPIPGPCAAIAGLSVSGLPTDKFLFLGFLPKKSGKKTKILTQAKEIKKNLGVTVIIYESPFRLVKTLENIKEVFGNIEIAVARELTKKFEEIHREKTSELLDLYENKKVKGELVVYF